MRLGNHKIIIKGCINKKHTMDIVRAFQNNELSIHVTIQGTHEEPIKVIGYNK